MRILQVSQHHHLRGGSDRVFLETCALLEQAGHDVARFCAAHPDNTPTPWSSYFPPAADFDHPGPRDLLRYLHNPTAARGLARLCDDFKPDVAHLHITYGKLTPSILKPLRQRGIPIVQTCHEWRAVSPNYELVSDTGDALKATGLRGAWRCVPQRFNRGSLARSALATAEWYLGRARGSVRHIDRFLAISDFQRDQLVALGLPADRVTRLYNFTDIPPPPSPKQYVDASGKHVLYFGRLDPVKGVQELPELAAAFPDVPFVIAGDGELRGTLEALIAEHDVTNLRLVGFHSGDALDALIRDARLTVLPAQWNEPFGLTVIESMVRGVPVLVTPRGALKELVAGTGAGRVESLGLWHGALDDLLHHTDLPAMGRAAYDWASTRYSPATHRDALLDTYTQLRPTPSP